MPRHLLSSEKIAKVEGRGGGENKVFVVDYAEASPLF